ncbi:MAG TPA: 30S ribosomal protein S9 [candidate division Zixibacteria bacterium]|nr:30S ribosomal protein S9 [candidate division Zixibacteria bacterium]
MANDNFSATGRRKEAVARVEMKLGKGKYAINEKRLTDYLTRETLVNHALRPLEITEMVGKVDLRCSTNGGGLSGQAGAIRLAIARALVRMNPEFQSPLRKGGFLTRDPREVERKKYGRPKARKRFQYSKR